MMKEGDIATLINNVNGMPAGAKGTIVYVYEGAYKGMNVYEIEFEFRSKGFDFDNKLVTVQELDVKEG
jgi:hypothetical protein